MSAYQRTFGRQQNILIITKTIKNNDTVSLQTINRLHWKYHSDRL